MSTGIVDKNTIVTCVQMGCDDYIAKPSTQKDILIVNLASNLAHRMGYTLLEMGSLQPESNAATLLGIDAPMIEEIKDEVKELVIGSSDIF